MCNYIPSFIVFFSIIQNVMDYTPKKQRYILAIDPVLCQQDQIIKAISQCLGTGMVKKVAEEDIYLNRELTVSVFCLHTFLKNTILEKTSHFQTFQSDQLLLDLKIETQFCKENFDINFTAENGTCNYYVPKTRT